jgi:myo-inositol 2-dehydrogenase / D-chiro-inositol 1-dehydrogenase
VATGELYVGYSGAFRASVPGSNQQGVCMLLEQLAIGLIGAGRIGRVHAGNLASRIPSANLLMVADVNEEAARRCAEDFRVPQSVADYRRVLDNPEIAAVLICSSTDTHARLIEEAAAAGKHIFCEKPIAFDLATIDRALSAVDRAGVKLQVGFNRRFDTNYRRVHQAIRGGEIGQLQLLHIVSRDPSPPPIAYIRTSGGMFLDMTIHDFDMLRFLTGAEVAEVFVMAGVSVDSEIGKAGDVDTAVAVLRCSDGTICTIENCRRAVYGYDQRVEALGSGGAISTSNNYQNSAVISGANSIYRDLPLNFFMERYAESYCTEMECFVDAVLQDRPVSVSGQDGRAPVVIALAARRSHAEGRPVQVAEVDTE